MARRFIRQYIPTPEKIRDSRWLRMFGAALHQPNLWHLNRYSVSRACGVGLFWAAMPMPFQMIPAAAMAIRYRANLALSVALVWVSNPFTMPFILWFAHRIGRFALGLPKSEREFSFTWEWVWDNLAHIWQPLLIGSLMLGFTAAAAGYLLGQGLWRWHAVRRWRRSRSETRKPGRLAALKKLKAATANLRLPKPDRRLPKPE